MTTESSPQGLVQNLSTSHVTIQNGVEHIELVNSSTKRIAFACKTLKKRATSLTTGCLDPNEMVILKVKCEKVTNVNEEPDRLTILWTNPPDGAAKQYRSEYFFEENLVRRKNLPNRFSTISAVLVTTEKQ